MYPRTFFATQINPQAGTCFVLMPFAERFRAVYDTITEVLQGRELSFSCKRADELFGGGHIVEDILRCIAEAEIIVADVTSRNPNVFYELGVAHMAKEMTNVLIITQTLDDVPFDLRHFRCIMYEQSSKGMLLLKKSLLDSVKEVCHRQYRFTITDRGSMQFEEKLLGYDRCFYTFELKFCRVGYEAAKFQLKLLRHALGRPIEVVEDEVYGLNCGESAPLRGTTWVLRLEGAEERQAHFQVAVELGKKRRKRRK